jgi:hypothetical protein
MLLKHFPNYQFGLTVLIALFSSGGAWAQEEAKSQKAAAKSPAEHSQAAAQADEKKSPAADEEEVPAEETDIDEEMAAEDAEAEAAAVARPVSPDMVQVYGWRESILIEGVEQKIAAKMDTGAYTSSIHAEERELFERDGKKWVRFIVTEPRKKNSPRVRIEAPLVRIARIKEPGGESHTREVVRLAFKIGGRKLRGEFTLNDRSNMLSPVLIGRTTIRELGWIDSSRTHLADEKIMR